MLKVRCEYITEIIFSMASDIPNFLRTLISDEGYTRSNAFFQSKSRKYIFVFASPKTFSIIHLAINSASDVPRFGRKPN